MYDHPGRGTSRNPANRYETLHVEPDEVDQVADGADGRDAEPTRFYRDASRSVLAESASPDVGFRFSLNPYRGCEHGCTYCYARPSHEHLGFSAGLDFERRIMVKDDAPALLRATLCSRRWRPEVVALSGNTDCYQPVERRLRLTRRCIEVFLEFRNPVEVVTKSALVARDADLFAALAEHDAARVRCSITTLDPELARRLEPRAASPQRRLDAMRALTAAGVPVGVMVAPVIPGLNDAEIPRILAAAAAAGARSAGWTLLRLARPLDELFTAWLAEHYPDRRARVLNRIRETRDGRLSDARFGRRMRGAGVYAEQIATLFALASRTHGLDRPLPPLSTTAFRRPPLVGEQMRLL
ncbi:MAG: PA0069 family radical SAM protein [Deltaproteobacteria bacterium]|nr:PA0069 family radical SAM protein [Deltaproteobacteria bacterium]